MNRRLNRSRRRGLRRIALNLLGLFQHRTRPRQLFGRTLHRKGQRRHHKHDGAPGGGEGKECSRATGPKCRLAARATERTRPNPQPEPLCSMITSIRTKQTDLKRAALTNKTGVVASPAARSTDWQSPSERSPTSLLRMTLPSPLPLDSYARQVLRRFWRAKIHDGRKRLRVKARSAHKCAVDFHLRHQSLDVVGLDAASVEDAKCGGSLGCELGRHARPNVFVRRRSHFRRSGAAGTDGPHRLIRNENTREFRSGQRCRGCLRTDTAALPRCGSLPFRLSDSPTQTMGVRPASRAALALRFTVSSVSPKNWRRSEWPRITALQPASTNHLHRDFAGKGALGGPVAVLRRLW